MRINKLVKNVGPIKSSQKKLSLTKKAVALFDKGRYAAAAKVFRSLLAVNTRDEFALFHLGLSLYESGEYRDSLRYWKQLQRINPTEKNLHLNMGCAYQGLRRNDLAIACFKKELEMNPLSPETLNS